MVLAPFIVFIVLTEAKSEQCWQLLLRSAALSVFLSGKRGFVPVAKSNPQQLDAVSVQLGLLIKYLPLIHSDPRCDCGGRVTVGVDSQKLLLIIQ